MRAYLVNMPADLYPRKHQIHRIESGLKSLSEELPQVSLA